MYQDGWTALFCAATCGHLSMIEYLVEKGPVDVTAQDEDVTHVIS